MRKEGLMSYEHVKAGKRICPFCRTLVSRFDGHVRSCSHRPNDAARTAAWVRVSCQHCSEEIAVHTDWFDPLLLCKSCREVRRTAIEAQRSRTRAQNQIANAFRPRMPRSRLMREVEGGLPSLGKRR